MPLEPGTRLAGYEILAPLGAGGLGEVYRARDTRLQRDIAVKVLPKHLASDPDALARFERDAPAVAALSHPNILTIHDVGTERGISFIVMELLEGETLRSRLEASSLPWRTVIDIGCSLAEGLAAAHSKGIIHRDLKPDNIFLTETGVKILDFGLAYRQQTLSDVDSDETVAIDTDAGKILGTAGYMSPEQVRAMPVGPPSDIFALGCVLYEMSTGRAAFKRPTAAQTMTAILEQDPPDVSSTGKQLPLEFSRIVAHCLQKSPHDRFQSARDLGFALKNLAESSGSFRPPPPPKKTSKGFSSLAVLPFQNAGGNPDTDYLGEGITEAIINSLSNLGKIRVVPRTLSFRYKSPDLDPGEVGRELKVDALLMGRVVQRGDMLSVQAELVDVTSESQLWGERYNCRFSNIFEVQDEIADQITAKLKLRLSGAEKKRLTKRPTQSAEAYEIYLKGRYHWNQRTPARLMKALEYYNAALEVDPNYALAHAGIAECYALFCTFSVIPPRECCPKAKAAALKALSLDPKLAEAHVSLGYVKGFYDYDWPGAEAEFKEAIALKPDYPTSHHWYGLALNALGRFDEAILETSRAQALDPPSCSIGSALVYSYYYARRYDEGIDKAQHVLEMDPNYGIAFYFMGLCYEQKKMIKEALEALNKAVALLDGNPTAAGGLGHALAASGQRDAALEALQKQLELAGKRYVSPLDVALIYAGLGDADNTFEWLNKACEDRSPWLPWTNSEPRSDPYRSDPRFQQILARINLGAAFSGSTRSGAENRPAIA